jgi:hypothetical protein
MDNLNYSKRNNMEYCKYLNEYDHQIEENKSKISDYK